MHVGHLYHSSQSSYVLDVSGIVYVLNVPTTLIIWVVWWSLSLGSDELTTTLYATEDLESCQRRIGAHLSWYRYEKILSVNLTPPFALFSL